MSNPNLFKIQDNPDGEHGHDEREVIRKKLSPQTKKQELTVLLSELPAKVLLRDPVTKTKNPVRNHQVKDIQELCDFYDSSCDTRDCAYCREHGVPKENIKNLIDWVV
jgi:hypothetical protein